MSGYDAGMKATATGGGGAVQFSFTFVEVDVTIRLSPEDAQHLSDQLHDAALNALGK